MSYDRLNMTNQVHCTHHLLLKIKNHAPEIWAKKGGILHNMNRYKEAIQTYDQAIKLNKNYAEAFCNKGFTLFTIELYDEAIVQCNP